MSGPGRARVSPAVVVAVVVGLLSCAAFSGVLLWAGSRVQRALGQAFGGDERWSEGVMARREVERQFSLTLPAGTYSIRARSLGFQDPLLEVLIPLADRAAFEKANGFTEVPSTEDLSAADEEVQRVGKPTGVLRAYDLEGLTNLEAPDGGGVDWYRRGSVLVYGDQVWLYLVAYGT